MANQEHIDVVIVGAGLSGIGAAYHLQERCPGRTYAILEGRESLGGTWDLFRYPGVRSDSDMHTLGFSFRPWIADKAIADGPAILEYLKDTAQAFGIEPYIRYRHRVKAASWSSEQARWTLTISTGPGVPARTLTCSFLFMCAGYYSYRKGHIPEFAGRNVFPGPVLHPQTWPEELDYADKRVAIIGSGATAVTLLPAMAERAAHVVMVQRSPTWIAAWPSVDKLANLLRRWLPGKLAYRLTRFKNTQFQQLMYRLARSDPARFRAGLLRNARKALGPDYPLAPHLTPTYDPWTQRLCAAPDGDFFRALRSGRGSIVTGQLQRFTQAGLLMEDGVEVEADIVVTATGLELVVLGEVAFSVDGVPVDFAERWTYKGVAFSDVPNLATSFGYVNASFTLRSDLICGFVCRLLNHMEATGTGQCTPRLRPEDAGMPELPFIEDFDSGYLRRGMHLFPKQGDRHPWRAPQKLATDRRNLARQPVDDGVMHFG